MITREPHQDDVLSLYSFQTDLNEDPKKEKNNSKNEDLINIFFLIFLYVIQGELN